MYNYIFEWAGLNENVAHEILSALMEVYGKPFTIPQNANYIHVHSKSCLTKHNAYLKLNSP